MGLISMENERYKRNNIYINETEQNLIAQTKILLAGAGLGSYIAECALRIGFENLTIIDGDSVELSNLNRQNYIMDNIGHSKTESLLKRLYEINPGANIKVENVFLNKNNLQDYIKDVDIAINALDFTSNIPFLFDDFCIDMGVKVLHPYNLGWSGFVFFLDKDYSLRQLQNVNKFEVNVVNYIIQNLNAQGISTEWIEQCLDQYLDIQHFMPPPQLSVGSFIISGMCTRIIVDIVLNRKTKKFPQFYYALF